MSDTATLAPERKCSIDQVFDPNFIELLQLVPTNPLVRALALKFTGKMPPEDCVTFDLLKDWVEFHCVKRSRPKTQDRSNVNGGIEITVRFSETEYGRCSYSVDRSGEDTFQVGEDELLTFVQEAIEAGGGLNEVIDQIATRIDDDAWNECDPNMEDYGDYDYDDWDSDHSDNAETNYSRDQIRNRILAFLQANHPELAGQL